jgi:diguanylate cyclase (GGDEF)-like protein
LRWREGRCVFVIAHDLTGLLERVNADEDAPLGSLTELLNKALFRDPLEQARARRAKENFGVLFLDLDHFKDVDDMIGRLACDDLLKAFAERLRGFVRAMDTVARFGGDEFVVLVTGLQDASHSAILAQKILCSLATPFQINGNEVSLTRSTGIFLYHADLDRADDYLERADKVLYVAEEEVRNTYRFHQETLDELFHSEVAIGTDLHHALEDEELTIEYQPQIDLRTNSVVGLEALARWSRIAGATHRVHGRCRAHESHRAVWQLGSSSGVCTGPDWARSGASAGYHGDQSLTAAAQGPGTRGGCAQRAWRERGCRRSVSDWRSPRAL